LIVEWRPRAREDFDKLIEWIETDSPMAALEMDERVVEQTSALPENPELYRAGRLRGTREMVLTPNVILVYRIRTRLKIIEIVRIVGARQDYPKRRSRNTAT
jgi:plasmid stabilization system protein ParE